MKTQTLNILAWIFIVIGVVLLFWRVFGNSHLSDSVIAALLIGLLFKMMAIGEEVTKLKLSFKYLANDFKEHRKHK